MNFQKLAIIVCSIFLFINCSEDEIGEEINYEVIEKNSLSYSEEIIPKQYIIFESQEQWMDFLPQIESRNPNQAEKLKNIDFDFTKNTLIFVIGEFYYNCCSEITINRIYKNDKSIVVDFTESGPGMATALSQAYKLLKIEKNL